jgi:hypothetical protein
MCTPDFSLHKPDLSPDQAPLIASREIPPPAQGIETSRLKGRR